jgi:hypothetical protein
LFDGKEPDADMRTSASAFVFMICVSLFGPSASAQFETRSVFYVGLTAPYSVATGDFNGDGIADLAVVNTAPSGEVEILLGNGDGTFRRGSSYPVGIFPWYASVASLRKNGVLDWS